MINASTGKGRVSLVTGSASPHGLGRAMINKFASEGAKVVVSDLPSRSKEGEEAVAQLNSQYGAVRIHHSLCPALQAFNCGDAIPSFFL